MVVTSAAADERFRRLDGREIAARFNDTTFTDEAHWSYRFQRGGRLTSIALGRSREWTWRVENGELCAENGPGSAPCHEVWVSRVAVELRRDGAPPEVGVLLRRR